MSGMRIAFSDRPAVFSRGNLLTCPQGVELIGEFADGGRPHQGCDPLLSLAPMRQCRLDRGLARGREMGDALALVDVANSIRTKPRRSRGSRLRPIVERSSAASAA